MEALEVGVIVRSRILPTDLVAMERQAGKVLQRFPAEMTSFLTTCSLDILSFPFFFSVQNQLFFSPKNEPLKPIGEKGEGNWIHVNHAFYQVIFGEDKLVEFIGKS